MKEIKLPPLGENIESGVVVRVAVKEGDEIKKEDTLVEIESEKVSLEVPSSVSGRVKEILVKEGQEIKVGDVIMRVEEKLKEETGEGNEKPREHEEKPREETIEEEEKEPAKAVSVEDIAGARVAGAGRDLPAAPSVRRFARELGVDIADVKGSGPHGQITQEDVKAYVCASRRQESEHVFEKVKLPDFSQWGTTEREPMSPFRIRTMNHLSLASRLVVPVTQFYKADVTKAEELLNKHSTEKRKLTITSFLIKVAAAALKTYPQFNVSADVEKKELIHKKYYHIGVAVNTDHGLIVPVIRDVDKKNIFELADELKTIAERARDKKIRQQELSGGCFTVTNLGKIGGSGFTPIVNWPEVAILGVSQSRLEPVFTGSAFSPRKVINFSLSYDHRFVDGVEGANFLHWIVEACEDPFLLELEG